MEAGARGGQAHERMEAEKESFKGGELDRLRERHTDGRTDADGRTAISGRTGLGRRRTATVRAVAAAGGPPLRYAVATTRSPGRRLIIRNTPPLQPSFRKRSTNAMHAMPRRTHAHRSFSPPRPPQAGAAGRAFDPDQSSRVTQSCCVREHRTRVRNEQRNLDKNFVG